MTARTSVDEEQRRNIHERLWNLDFNERVMFLGSRVQPQLVKRRKKDSKGERQRKESFERLDVFVKTSKSNPSTSESNAQVKGLVYFHRQTREQKQFPQISFQLKK